MYFVHRGQSTPRLIFSRINGLNIARREKHQSIVHVDRTCEVLSWSIMSCQIGRKVGTSFFVKEKAGVFTTNLSMSKFSTKETTFCRKTYNFAYFSQISSLKPRLHERFFARAGDAIFSNFVASPAQDENHTCSHP